MQINRKLTMKLIALIFVIVFAVALADDNPWVKAKKECQEDPATRFDDSTADHSGNSKKYSPEFGAHILCVSKKIGSQKADGEIDEAVLKSHLEKMIKDPEKVKEVFSHCAEKKESPEKTAAHLHACIRHFVPKPDHQ